MQPQRPIYLDYNATTPIDPAVRQAMLPYLDEHFGNPSSTHAYGRAAHHAVEKGRLQLAELVGASSSEIIFTGNGTEASNQALFGVTRRHRSQACDWQIIISAVEHPATMQPALELAEQGFKLVVLPVDRYGMVQLEALEAALKKKTLLVSIMHSNNEVGTLQPIKQISKLAHAVGALVHTDVAQSLGKLPVDVDELGVDLMTIAGHKLYAPKGIGALYVRHGTPVDSFVYGAAHERGRRAGTENVPYIVGLGQAAEIAQHTLRQTTPQLQELRDRLWSLLHDGLGDRIQLHGHPTERLPNTINFSIAGWIGDDLLEACPGIAGSTGSACHAGKMDVSPVLAAMGVPVPIARGAVRLSVGRFTTEEEVERGSKEIVDITLVPGLRPGM
jgi:cysteine desulfurase